MYRQGLLNTMSIIRSAEIGSGTEGLVDQALHDRVDHLIGHFTGQGDFSETQARALRRQIVKLLVRRLSMLSDIARYPEILDEDVAEPIFIIGFARSGTTLLQSLLGQDPANRLVAAWQVREPSPPPGEMPVAVQRLRNAAQEVHAFLDRCPGLLAMHPYWDAGADTPVEDEEIMSLDFLMSYPSLLYDAPDMGMIEQIGDAEPGYRFLKQFMQHQQWRQPRKRWVMKGVEHQSQLATLLRIFPDAHCIWAHREPADFLPSLLSIGATVFDGVTDGKADRKLLGPAYLERFKERVTAMVADPLLDDPHVLHMPFEQIVRDPVAAIEKAYGLWNMRLSGEAADAMRAWLADPGNRSDRYRRHSYDFAPFGIDWAQHDAAFDGYRQRFLEHAHG